MSGRLGTLRCRYRVHGAADRTDAGRLHRIAAERLPDELAPALADLGDGGAVYVLRRVLARSTLDLSVGQDRALARCWGRDLARSVATTISGDSGDGANLVRFDSQADYVAAFVADLLDGTAWRRWYFGAFAHHRQGTDRQAIEAVLVEHHNDLGPVAAALARRGRLELLLVTIDPTALVLPGAARADPDLSTATARAAIADGWRPLVTAAVRVADALGLWTAAPPDLAVLVGRWIATGHRQPDWLDPAALSDAVATVAGWLVRTGVMRPPLAGAGLTAAVAALDWLDVPRLAAALLALGTDRAGGTALPSRAAAPAATPRQRELLVALQTAIRARPPVLVPSRDAGPSNIIRVLAALAEIDPDRAADPLVPVLIDQLLGAWVAILTAEAPAPVIDAVTAGDPGAAVAAWRRTAGHPADDAAGAAVGVVARWGEPAGAVLGALLDPRICGGPRVFGTTTGTERPAWPAGTSGTSRSRAAAGPAATRTARPGEPDDVSLSESRGPGGTQTFASPVAGILLLQRVLLDVRLAALAERHHFPPAGPGHLLSAIGLRWTGSPGAENGLIDPAVRLLAGRDGPMTTDDLTAAWQDVPLGAQVEWRTVVDDLRIAHRLADRAPDSDDGTDPIEQTAAAMLEIWARWLRGFEHSSAPFLLDRFVRRPGSVTTSHDLVIVRLPRRPLDTVLEMSGYLRPIERLAGLASQRFEFVVGAL